MASKPRDLLVRFLADVNPFLRSTDAVEDAYRDMATDADRVADAGEKSARRLATAYDRAADEMKRDARDTKKVTADSYADAGREAGNEFASNIGEAVSSGDISGVLSGTAGGLAATFGAGGPIGIALAALAGVGVAAFGAMQKGAEQAKAAAQLAFDELHEQTTNEARLNAVLTDRFGSTLEGWEQIQRYAEASGVDAGVIADALASGGPKAKNLADKFLAIMRAQYETTGELDKQASLLIDAEDDLRDRATAMERAAAAAKTESKYLKASEGALARSSRYYAARGSAYAPGGSMYNSQVPTYATGKRG